MISTRELVDTLVTLRSKKNRTVKCITIENINTIGGPMSLKKTRN